MKTVCAAENFSDGSMASLMLTQSGRGNRTMKSKRGLMTMLVGLAMLATPLTAAAKDHNFYAQNNHEARAAAHSYAREVRGGGVTPRDFRGEHAWGAYSPYRNYGRAYNRGYYGAPGYVAPYYGGGVPGYAVGNGCGRAQSVMNQYYRDRNYGHPAAANDLLRQNPWAFRSGCAAAPVGGGFGGFGRLFGGAPVYNNYGGYGGYNGAYNGGYNGGYGQPYGGASMLAPLLQQFVR
jgi:hypothetical protein